MLDPPFKREQCHFQYRQSIFFFVFQINHLTSTFPPHQKYIFSTRTQLDEVVISQSTKNKLRTELETLQRDIIGHKNRQMMFAVDEAIQAIKKEIEILSKSGAKTAVLKMNIGSDAKAIKRAMDEIRKVAENMSFLGITEEQDKITVFAVVTDEAQKSGLKANDWVSASIASCGGRGGGKPSMAQGSTAEVAKLGLVLEEGRRYLINVSK